MYYYHLYVLATLTVAHLAGLATPLGLAPPWDEMRVKHAWNAVPANWESLGPPPPGTTFDLHVALKPHNENALIDTLYEVSTPGHQKYGAHLSKEEVAELVAPHPDAFELVRSWLAHHDVQSSSSSITHGGSWLTLTGVPVSKANELLGASYQLYRYAGTNETAILRTVGYALPTVLHAHVQTVAPTTSFASARTLRQQAPHSDSFGAEGPPAKAVSRDLSITPPMLRWLYTTSYYVPAATDRNVLGIVGFDNEFPSPIDLTTFMDAFRTEGRTASFTVEQVDDGDGPSHIGLEANLAMQYSQGITYPTPHVYYSTGGQMVASPHGLPALGDVFLAWTAYVISQPDIPQTISIPFSVNEKDVPLEYAASVCLLFAQLGARGVSVLFMSGDDGVGAGDCKAKDGSGRIQFIPKFPASCPWVTSVGGTTGSNPEVAVGISGGGFSNFFPRPAYQTDTVPAFLQLLGHYYDGFYAATGRGIPDISAQALNYLGFATVDSNPGLVRMSSTSCAVTTAAGIISLLNDYLTSKGRPPLGFLNPWLYSKIQYRVEGIKDIKSGSNPGCDTHGFPTAPGWDPVTGLGTPDFFGMQYALDHM